MTHIEHSEKMFCMKVFLIILVLLLNFQSLTKSDDNIRDFQIEGMSIGDSALNYFTKEELKNALEIGKYKSDKFFYYFLKYKNSDIYEYLQIHVKKNDSNLIIYGVEGHIIYSENIDECYNKMDSVKLDIDKSFNVKSQRDTGKHPIDVTGESTYSRIMYQFQNKRGYAEIICYNFSEKKEREGMYDRFVISLGTNELLDWLSNEAY